MDACERRGLYCEWHSARGIGLSPRLCYPTRQSSPWLVLPAVAAGMGFDRRPISMLSVSIVGVRHAYRLDTPLAESYREYIRRTLRNLKNNDAPTLLQ